jgi:quercetin dioxygenase-like cupin family protein
VRSTPALLLPDIHALMTDEASSHGNCNAFTVAAAFEERAAGKPGSERRASMNKLGTMAIGLAAGGTVFSAGTSGEPSLDPAVVNAGMEHVKFENSHVRAIEGVLKPGDKEQMHSHPAFVVYMIAGGKIRNNFADGKVVDAELKTGDVLYREPQTHWVENIGTTTIHFLVVELKNPK